MLRNKVLMVMKPALLAVFLCGVFLSDSFAESNDDRDSKLSVIVSNFTAHIKFDSNGDAEEIIPYFLNSLKPWGLVIDLACFIAFGLVAVLLTMIFPTNVKRISYAMKQEFWKSAAIGVAVQLAFIPALLIMVISCLGIPLIPFAILFCIAAWLLGKVGLCAAIGSRCLESFGKPQPAVISMVVLGFAGLSILVILGSLANMAGYPFSNLGIILNFTYYTVLFLGTTVGLGAVCITSFGRRDVEVAFPMAPVIPFGGGSSAASGLVYCRTCGKQVAAKAMMCPGCGVGPFDGRAYCSNCGNPTEPNAIACVKCGIAAHYAGNSQKNFVTALLLSILLGSLGVDRFYLGYVLLGILKLFTFGGFGIWWLIDVILIATNSLKDANGVPMKR